MMKLLLLFSSLLVVTKAVTQCPQVVYDMVNGNPNDDNDDGTGAYSETANMGCLFADGEEDQIFDKYEKALGRCQQLLGDNARLAEILSAEDQAEATKVMKQAEARFKWQDPELSMVVGSGLKRILMMM